ncbi:NAD(P)-dependent alcohol dehydrogenase [Acetobacterium malicum]|uniref:NAD(P)-dependent alcohol dehydrogenase n=1 Tax=Acetobacterium malicum TaxID=52692 RepID=UPI000401ED1A|nr:NAD(P)-dependent alcohol dehydrogenase [Acetobacterium dehalogenans]
MLSKAAVVHNKGEKYVIEEIEVAAPKADEVLVKIVGVGLCHTDQLGQEQLIPVPLPAVFGHEGSGIVMEVGEGVTGIKVGDHVVLSYSSCGICENCLDGKPYCCVNNGMLQFSGVMADGTSRLSLNGKKVSSFFGQSSFSQYSVANQRNVVVVDKEVDLTILGPLGCGFETGAGTVLNALKPEFGSTIAVFGCGSLGLAAIMAAKIANCHKIIAVGGTASKLELAKELGATDTVNTREVKDVVAEIKRITNGGAHYSIDTTGAEPVIKNALYCLRTLGVCAEVGVSGDVTMNIFDAITMEGRTLVGVIQGNSVPQLFIPKLIEYYKNGQFPFDKLIKIYDFEKINEAYDDVHKGETVKGVLKVSEV